MDQVLGLWWVSARLPPAPTATASNPDKLGITHFVLRRQAFSGVRVVVPVLAVLLQALLVNEHDCLNFFGRQGCRIGRQADLLPGQVVLRQEEQGVQVREFFIDLILQFLQRIVVQIPQSSSAGD